jgi:hypothetical protein
MSRRRHEMIAACLGFGVTGSMVLLLGYIAFVNGSNLAAAACGAAYGAAASSFTFDMVRIWRRHDD